MTDLSLPQMQTLHEASKGPLGRAYNANTLRALCRRGFLVMQWVVDPVSSPTATVYDLKINDRLYYITEAGLAMLRTISRGA